MNQKKYTTEEILNDNNLILDIKRDIIFKNCFLNLACKPYLISLISKIFNISCNELNEHFIIKNSELPSRKIDKKSSYTDLICSYKNIDFILEMNYSNDNDIYEKNMDYLFKQHSGKISKSNRYGKDIYTYLINIDNYDCLKEKDLVYTSTINYPKYNICLYKNIGVYHINLAYLRKKVYNKEELNELEKLLLIFISQRKDEIRSIANMSEIEGVIEVMERMKYENDYIATYNREEFEDYLRERDEKEREKTRKMALKNKQDKMKNKQDEMKNKQVEMKNKQDEMKNKQVEMKNKQEKSLIEKDKKQFYNEKKSIVSEFKRLGLSIGKISEITKLPIDQIKMLL